MKILTCCLLFTWLCSTASAQSAADSAAAAIRRHLKPGKHPVHYFRLGLNGADLYGDDLLDITAKGDILNFKGTGKASGLDSVRFDLARNIALFRQRQIPFIRIEHIRAADNGFHTPGVTYAYELSISSMTDSTDMSTLRMERYDFGISYLSATGKTMIVFMKTIMKVQGDKPNIKPDILTFLID